MTQGTSTSAKVQKLSQSPILLTLKDQLGHQFSLQVDSHAEMIDALRYYGGLGYTSGAVPAEGAALPLALFQVFDFRLLGIANKSMFVAGSGADAKLNLPINGKTFKHRVLPANKAKKMNFKLSFSRGAAPTDDESVTTGGEIKYVQLINFSGGSAFIPAHLRWLAIPGSIDTQGYVTEIYNRLPEDGDDEEALMEAMKVVYRDREMPPYAAQLVTPTLPYSKKNK